MKTVRISLPGVASKTPAGGHPITRKTVWARVMGERKSRIAQPLEIEFDLPDVPAGKFAARDGYTITRLPGGLVFLRSRVRA